MLWNWIWWTVPQEHIRRYVIMLALILIIIPQYIFGIMYTTLGFFLNLIWFDLIFYCWVKVKEQLERMDK
tara:strand:- start:826 stop:1035 length:210 start_codon:yes stop_codon:yes gene_type:complete